MARRPVDTHACIPRLIACSVVPLLSTAALHATQPLAFPGAVGQGAVALGGREGDVYHVTNLRDYNSQRGERKIRGSLRHAIRSADGPRTIVFDVSGAIPLASPLKILKNNITIAGQTSPGGITLWGYPVEISQTSDVIVRYLRFRTGDFHATARNHRPARGNADLTGDDGNTLFVGNGSQRIVLDHLSLSWSMDETLSVTRSNDVTVQHCLIAESLNDSYHSKGPHGYGSLIRGNLTTDQQDKAKRGYTFYGNLWANHRARNPSIAGQQTLRKDQSESQRGRTDLNLVNNVVYGWRDRPSHRSTSGSIRVNMIGNYYVNGLASDGKYIFNEDNPGETFLFHHDNYHDQDQDATHRGQLAGGPANLKEKFVGFEFGEDSLIGKDEGEPFPFIESVAAGIVPAEENYRRVLRHVGASLHRDVIDQRIISAVEGRTGDLIDSQEAFRDQRGVLPGIDDLPEVRRPPGFDVDRDGIADSFETLHGLDPNDPRDSQANDLSKNGLTNLEIYLDALVRRSESSPE